MENALNVAWKLLLRHKIFIFAYKIHCIYLCYQSISIYYPDKSYSYFLIKRMLDNILQFSLEWFLTFLLSTSTIIWMFEFNLHWPIDQGLNRQFVLSRHKVSTLYRCILYIEAKYILWIIVTLFTLHCNSNRNYVKKYYLFSRLGKYNISNNNDAAMCQIAVAWVPFPISIRSN